MQDEQPEAPHLVARGARLAGVDAELHDLDPARVVAGEALDHWGDHAAGRAPGRPEVDEHGDGGDHLLVEVLGPRVDDPRERVVARRASRDALPLRPDAVPAPAGDAAD